MEQVSPSSRPTTINIDDIITVLRSATQHQYNARELHTAVSPTLFFFE